MHAGSFAWAAPEVLTNERCTEKADIFSMGIVLWWVVAPFAKFNHLTFNLLSTVVYRDWVFLTRAYACCREIVTGEAPVRGGRREVRYVKVPFTVLIQSACI